MAKLKNWNKSSGLTWYYKGQPNRWRIQKLYIDHIVPSKGWRVVVVDSSGYTEWYFPTKKEAMADAMDYMRDI